jgi:hypothetical protein
MNLVFRHPFSAVAVIDTGLLNGGGSGTAEVIVVVTGVSFP